MSRKKLRITLVGAGHYSRDLIGPKYRENPDVELFAVISRSASVESLKGSALEGLPIFRNADEWKKSFGMPTERDVFDVAMFPEYAADALKDLVAIGAKNFILPKPVATTGAQLDDLMKSQKEHGLKIMVASQWHYSELPKRLAEEMKKAGDVSSVEINFSQPFSNERLKRYTPVNALLPHLLQIAHSIGLNGRLKEVKLTDTLITVVKELPDGGTLTMKSDMKAEKHERYVKAYVKGGSRETPALFADYLNGFKDGKCVKPLVLAVDGKKQEMIEDTLRLMVAAEVSAFLEKTGKALMLGDYLPVARSLLEIAERK